MTSTASEQRKALVSALRAVHADSSTLCEGWTAQDLALHIVIRDSRPDILLGQSLPLIGPRARRAAQKLRSTGYENLIQRVEKGPPAAAPQSLRPIDDAMNTAEFYIHAQDVLRAGPDAVASQHDISEESRRRIWRQASAVFFPLAAKKRGRRITFSTPDYGAVTRGSARSPALLLRGAPEELTLWASGREEHAVVEVIEG